MPFDLKEMMPFLVIGGLIFIYILTYLLNRSTPVPEECLSVLDEATCNSCKNFACSHKGSSNVTN